MFWRQWKTELIKRYRLNREGIKLVVELFIRFPLDNQQLHRRIKANFMAIAEYGRQWLSLQDVLTPYLSPQPGAQLKYNMQVITQITISPMRKKHRISSLSPFIC
ncbi:hypothetical protein N1851_014419 [Merluccius polli]|uniref:Uncharacterized protein n=1 Tax=Merluccius polli TaxID=89951 RepID=A0AA47MTJ4_MERPO|nr:hypothetical protein N1851_014419 [Merluccius polli]